MALPKAENQHLTDVDDPPINEDTWSIKGMLITDFQIFKRFVKI